MKMKKITTGLLAGGLVLALSGCYKVDANYEFQEDGTVSGTMTAGMHKDALKQMEELGDMNGEADGSEGEDPTEFFEEGDYPEGSKVEDWAEGDYVGQKLTFEDATIEEMLGDDTGESEEFDVKLEDGKYYVHLTNLESTIGEDTGEAGPEMEEFFKLYGEPEINMTLAFPGKITKHEGPGTVKDNALTLTLEDISTGEDVIVEADAKKSAADKVADSASDNKVGLMIGGGVALLLLLGLGGVLMARSRKASA